MGLQLSGAAGSGAGATIAQNADINVTPFVDIMLVLLIIFMVAAPMATVSTKLDLPPPQAPTRPVAEPVFVSVQNDGRLFIGGRETRAETLAADLCAALGGGDCTQQRLFLRAEAEVPYDRFMAVMNTLNAEGFHQIGLINEDID